MADDSLPLAGHWPCQRTPGPNLPPRLVAALYVLLRDHVQPGDLEQVAINVTDHSEHPNYTNPHLEGYARALATFLTDDPCQCRSYHERTGQHADVCPLYREPTDGR